MVMFLRQLAFRLLRARHHQKYKRRRPPRARTILISNTQLTFPVPSPDIHVPLGRPDSIMSTTHFDLDECGWESLGNAEERDGSQ